MVVVKRPAATAAGVAAFKNVVIRGPGPLPADSPALPPGPDMDSRRFTATSSRCTRLDNSAIPEGRSQRRLRYVQLDTKKRIDPTARWVLALDGLGVCKRHEVICISEAQWDSVFQYSSNWGPSRSRDNNCCN